MSLAIGKYNGYRVGDVIYAPPGGEDIGPIFPMGT